MGQGFFGPNGFIYCKEDEKGDVTIYWADKKYYAFNRKDTLSKNIGIAIMASIGVMHKTIAEIFKVGRNTVTRVEKIYKREGLPGLLKYKQGPEVIEKELKQFVIHRYIELKGTRGYQNEILSEVGRMHRAGQFCTGLSRSMMHKIIREYKRQDHDHRGVGNAEEDRGGDEEATVMETDRCVVEAGGASAAMAILGEIGVDRHILGDGQTDKAHYSNTELAVSYALLNAAGLVTVEQNFKQLPRETMGGIIGCRKLPGLQVFRSRVPVMVESMDMERVILATSRRACKVFSFSKVVYIDEHFMPYFGAADTLYGYNSQRRLSMHGRKHYFVHDESGMPVFTVMSDGYRGMRHFIVDVDAKLRWVYGVGKKKLLEIFDRGGYGKEFCIGISRQIRFICWRSDARSMPRIRKWEKVIVHHQGNSIGEDEKHTFYAWEKKVEFKVGKKRAVFREIWIRSGRKVSPALTNVLGMRLENVVRYLTRRWGAQENMFKELKSHGIDRIHSYSKEKYSEEFLYSRGLEDEKRGVRHETDNPKVKKLSKKRGTLKEQWMRLLARLEKMGKKKMTKPMKALRFKTRGLERRIRNLDLQIKALPKKIQLMKRIQEEEIERLCDQKKLFFDWLKICAIWSKRKIVEIVKPIYRDLRDVNKFVDKILKSRTYSVLKGDVLYVEFPTQRSKKDDDTLRHLCKELNSYKGAIKGMRFQRLRFSVRVKD